MTSKLIQGIQKTYSFFSYYYFLFPEWIFQKDKDGRGEVEMIDFNSDTKEEEEEEVVGFQYTKL